MKDGKPDLVHMTFATGRTSSQGHGLGVRRAGQEADGLYAEGVTVMAENNFVPPTEALSEPELRRANSDPKGVLQKNLKIFVYLGAALLVIAAALFSSTSKRRPRSRRRQRSAAAAHLQDNTDNNVQDLKNQLKAEREKEQQQSAATVAPDGDPALASATPRNGQPPQPMGRPALRRHVFPANLAHNPPTVRRVMVNRAMRSLNSRRNSSKLNSSPQRSASEPTSHASPRILCTPCHGTATTSAGTGPPNQLAPAGPRQEVSSLQSPRAQENRKRQPMATNVP